MEKYIIQGGNRLKGEVEISGAKNAVVAIIPATILAEGKCVLKNVPNISDVTIITRILKEMGAEVRLLDKTTLEIDTTNIREGEVSYEMTQQLRASYYLMGALLGRFHESKVSLPGGCNFGVRPIDQHIKGFEHLGANVNIDRGVVRAKADHLLGNQIYFDVVSVGATMNVMLAAVKAKGVTVIENAAKEPHIVDLANFLNSMGADIMGAGTDVIKIHGVEKMHGANYTVIPDQIEAGTFMVMAAATKGDLLIKNVIPKHLEPITAKIRNMGVSVEEFDDSIRVSYDGENPLVKENIKTMPHPGFPTDMQPQMTTLLCLAKGTSVVTEGVWDNRFKYVDELKRMGACIQVDGKVAVVEGIDGFMGAPVKATDLRAGAALIIAALAGNGTTELDGITHVERGYTDLLCKLHGINADVKKVFVPTSINVTKAL